MKNKFKLSSNFTNKNYEKEKFKEISQKEIIFNYFKNNENRPIKHAEIVDFATKKYEKITGNKFRDPDRTIRKLYENGFLIKLSKGIYKYDSSYMNEDKTKNLFSEAQKKIILNLGDNKCAICGLGKCDGEELHIDHMIPLDKGGTNDISNGQILCSRHNFLKKNFSQTETGKRFFLNLQQKISTEIEIDEKLKMFINEVLELYDKYNINGHISITKK